MPVVSHACQTRGAVPAMDTTLLARWLTKVPEHDNGGHHERTCAGCHAQPVFEVIVIKKGWNVPVVIKTWNLVTGRRQTGFAQSEHIHLLVENVLPK